MKREKSLLTGILLTVFFLTLFGIQMGIPFRWHVDEVYATSVRFLGERSIAAVHDSSILHPAAYPIVLALFLIPYFVFLKLSGYPLELAASSGRISWTQMAFDYPELTSGIILWSRFSSVLIGVASCYLLYRLGKKMINARTGLCSALALALTMDFSGTNHFATRTPLVSFLTLLSFYYAVKFHLSGFNSRLIKLAALFAGLCFSTKANGSIAFLPLCVAVWFAPWRLINAGRVLLFLAAGVVLGNPLLLVYPSQYFERYLFFFSGYLVHIGPLPPDATGHLEFFERGIGWVNSFIQVLYGMGVPLAVFALIGGAVYFSRKNWGFQKWIMGSFLLVYWTLISVSEFGVFKAHTKASVLLAPWIALLAGIGLERFISSPHWKLPKRVAVVLTLCFSFWYCLCADWVFINGDTRYRVTQWIKGNIPKGSAIAFFSQINEGASEELYRDYHILYGDLDSSDLEGISPFKDLRKRPLDYFSSMLEKGPSAEYVLLSFDSFLKLENAKKPTHPPAASRQEVVRRFLKGDYPYQLIKEFIPGNYKEAGSKEPAGVSLPHSFWKNPISNMGYISPIVFIYQRTGDSLDERQRKRT